MTTRTDRRKLKWLRHTTHQCPCCGKPTEWAVVWEPVNHHNTRHIYVSCPCGFRVELPEDWP
jgi:hypothetical protein